MTTMIKQGVPAGGLKKVGQIVPTNGHVFNPKHNAMGVAVELLSTHTPGAPVVDAKGEFMGFISELDILRALEEKKDLNQLTADDVMVKDRIFVSESARNRIQVYRKQSPTFVGPRL